MYLLEAIVLATLHQIPQSIHPQVTLILYQTVSLSQFTLFQHSQKAAFQMQLSAFLLPQSKTMRFRAPLQRFCPQFKMGNVTPPSSFPSTSTDFASLNTQSTSTPSPSLRDKPSTASTDDHSALPTTIYKKKNCRKPTKKNLSELISENRLILKPPLRIDYRGSH